MMKKVASSEENISNSRLECKNHTLFGTRMGKTDTLYWLKMGPGLTHLFGPYKGVLPGILPFSFYVYVTITTHDSRMLS